MFKKVGLDQSKFGFQYSHLEIIYGDINEFDILI